MKVHLYEVTVYSKTRIQVQEQRNSVTRRRFFVLRLIKSSQQVKGVIIYGIFKCLSFVISVLLFLIPTNSRLPRVRASALRIIKAKIVSVVSLPQSRQSAKLFLQSLELGLPHSLTRKRVCLPPLLPEGRGTIASGRGGGGPIPTRGHALWYSVLYIMYLCIL
jgi:hypothetical protein